MRDETTRSLTFALTVVIGVVFVASGLMLLNQVRHPAYTQAGILLLPGGLFTIAVAVRRQLPALLGKISLDRKAKLLLVSLAAVVLLSWGSLFMSRGDAAGGLAGLVLGLGFLAVFLRMVTTSKRSLSPRELETLKREMRRASLRPLGVTVLAALTAADGVSSVLVAIFFSMLEVRYYPRIPSLVLSVLLLFLFIGFLKTSVAFGFSNGSRWSWETAVVYNSLHLAVSTFAFVLWPFLFVFQLGAFGPVIFLGSGLTTPVVMLSMILSILTLYYLNRTQVKSFFGKVRMESILRQSYP